MTPQQRRLKLFLIAGAVFGAALSIAITLLMDVLYADALGGTWQDAIVKDLKNVLSVSVEKESPLVLAVFLVILLILGAFGAVMGVIFGFFVYQFFSFLLKE